MIHGGVHVLGVDVHRRAPVKELRLRIIMGWKPWITTNAALQFFLVDVNRTCVHVFCPPLPPPSFAGNVGVIKRRWTDGRRQS